MYTGLIGAIKVANACGEYKTLAYISGWSVDEQAEIIDCSKFSESDKKSIVGAKSWSASADGTVCFDCDGGHDELFEAHHLGKPLLFHFHLSDGDLPNAKEDTYLCGKGFIESISMNLSADDRGTISLSVSGDGPLDLYVKGKNVASEREHNDAVGLCIDSNGHLCAVVPDTLDGSSVWVDATGHLFMKI